MFRTSVRDYETRTSNHHHQRKPNKTDSCQCKAAKRIGKIRALRSQINTEDRQLETTSRSMTMNRKEPNCSEEKKDEHATFTLYLIRHGEALHNMMEKLAREQAKKEAEAKGLPPEEVELLVKAAQVAVLENATLFDAPLSAVGEEEAHGARQVMKELHAKGLPEPAEVLVSPLQRAMQTANIIFPDCDNIHVREDLRERKTGRACDLRQSAEVLAQRGSFARFSMVNLRMLSHTKCMLEELRGMKLKDISEDDFGVVEEENKVEESPMLRGRTKRLARLLMDSDHRVIAIVTHKAYLRELERGTLGQESATEFSNCEIRVYKVKCKDYFLSDVDRLA